MHDLQKKLLALSQNRDLNKMSLRAIGKLLGKRVHPQQVKHHLNKLIESEMLPSDKNPNICKKIALGLSKNIDLISIPILGYANCGKATMIAEEQLEGFLNVSAKMLEKKKNIFAIKAIGNSMNKASIGKDKLSIEDGDYVIIDKDDKTPKTNSYVLSIIDGLANIKKIVIDKERARIILLSESSEEHPPIFISEKDAIGYIVSGRVIQVIKNQM